ncbi:MAG: Ig-like domain-containing protein, partial [Mariprofundales bacterium]
TASAVGVWSIPNTDAALLALADSTYSVTATQTTVVQGAVKTSAASPAKNLTIDTVATAPLINISNNVTSPAIDVIDAVAATHTLVASNTPLISGTAEANALISISDAVGNTRLGAAVTKTTFANTAGIWSLTLPALGADGAASLNVIQQDSAGNLSPAGNISFEIDTVVSTLAITSVATTTISFPPLSGTAEPALGITANTISIDILQNATLLETIPATVAANGNWSGTPTNAVPAGVLTINLKQTDEAGNILVATQTLQNNTVVTIPTISNGTVPINPNTIVAPAIYGTALVNVGASVDVILTDKANPVNINNINNITVDAQGNWSVNATQLLSIADASYVITATQTTTTGQKIGTSSPISSANLLIIDTAIIAPVINNIDGVTVTTTHATAN